jgi:hypothetical protein
MGEHEPQPVRPEDISPHDATEVARLIAGHPEYTHTERWSKLEAEDAPVVREALKIANLHRQNKTDPGDAFLEGVSYADAVRKEQEARTKFAASMSAGVNNVEISTKERQKRAGLFGIKLGAIAILSTVFQRKPNNKVEF